MLYERLEKELESKGWSRNKLGLESKISPSSISQAMNGNIPMFPGWKKKIADTLEVLEEELFPDHEENKED